MRGYDPVKVARIASAQSNRQWQPLSDQFKRQYAANAGFVGKKFCRLAETLDAPGISLR
jgi:hypothetical protein